MFKFTKTGVFFISITIIFCIVQIFILQYAIKTEIDEEMMEQVEIKQGETPVVETTDESEIWQIEISKISLVATISEGTTKEVLNQYVGHFENTSKNLLKYLNLDCVYPFPNSSVRFFKYSFIIPSP